MIREVYKMSVKIETILSPARKQQMTALVTSCLTAFPAPLSVPTDGDVFFFWEQEETIHSPELYAFLALYLTEDGLWECSAFTLPNRRQNGYFSDLLEAAERAYPDYEFSFPVPDLETSLPAKSALASIGAEFWYQEHMMALQADNPSWSTFFPENPDFCLSLQIQPESSEASDSSYNLSVHGFFSENCVASCSLAISTHKSQTTCCLHHVLVPPSLRGQGWGTRFLYTLLPALKEQGVTSFLLQVSGDNLPAISLYKKTGFQITETLSYYLY